MPKWGKAEGHDNAAIYNYRCQHITPNLPYNLLKIARYKKRYSTNSNQIR